jgi:hypothetical protein
MHKHYVATAQECNTSTSTAHRRLPRDVEAQSGEITSLGGVPRLATAI